MEKTYEIRDDQSTELLQELHILTREKKINQDSRRKLKQIYHLINFIEPIIKSYNDQPFSLVDHGAGKSYLGFILYDLIIKNTLGEIIGVEKNQKLVKKSQDLQKKCKFKNMSFISEEIVDSSTFIDDVNIVTALHACDMATDDAIDFALNKKAEWIILVPCCQSEVYKALKSSKSENMGSPFVELYRHGIHTREFGSHLTNVLRCLKLESEGYKVSVTELVGWEHSLKNELIIAENIGQKRSQSKVRAEQIISDLKINNLANRFL